MSANLTLSWPAGLICVSDRRLTDLVTRKITTNRCTKMTLFACADAYGVIVYNGIGPDLTGATPSDWIMELAEKKVFDSAIGEVLQAIGADLESRLRPIRAKYGASRTRHTFFVPVWQAGVPVVHAISNYERADQRGEQPKGTEQVTHKQFNAVERVTRTRREVQLARLVSGPLWVRTRITYGLPSMSSAEQRLRNCQI